MNVDPSIVWKDQFANPAAEHRACPFWFWNGDLEPAELVRQIHQMHVQGIGGFIIHSRLGCQVPYLSETWFDRCRVAVEEAAKLGMKVWLYDEDNWPSGYAGGQTIATNPDLAAQHLAVERHFVAEGGSVRLHVQHPEQIVAVLAVSITQTQPRPRHPLITSNHQAVFDHRFAEGPATTVAHENGKLNWQAPPGRWCLMVFRQKQTHFCPAYCGSGYVDLLNPATTQAFIRLTHERYYQKLGKYFGQTILGFFTDEPGFYNNFLDRDPGTVPWTGDFLREFNKRRGYDLLPWLAALWEEAGPRTEQVRADYWRTVAELFEQNFTGQMARWCDEHGVQLTGHLLIEESLLAMQRFAANPFSVLRPLHVTAVDRIDEQDQKISEKLVASIGHANGRQRILSETFALIGWKLAPAYMKRIVDFQFVRGVNWLVPHAFYYSIEDWRKMECPPSVFFQNPWWEHSRPLWDHVARLSALLSQGKHVAPVALYYPMEHAWATVRPESPGPTLGVYPPPYFPFKTPIEPHPVESTDAALNRIAKALTGGQYDYDLVDHELMAGASGEGTELKIGPESFRAVVAPPMEAISGRALNKMLQFAEGGGLVIFAGRLPGQVLDEKVDGWEDLAAKLSGLAQSTTIAHGRGQVGFVPVGESGILQLLGRKVTPDLQVLPGEATSQRHLLETQHHQFRQSEYPKVAQALAYHRRQMGQMSVYFIVNESDREFEAVLELAGGGSVERWEAQTNVREPLAGQGGTEDRARVVVRFGAWQSQLLVVHGEPAETPVARQFLWSRPVDGWTLEVGGRRHEGELLSWHELGLPAHSGTGVYRARFELDSELPANARLELDLGMVLETARVKINGVQLPPLAFGPYVADLTAHVAGGRNQIEVEVANTLLNSLEQVERPSGMLGPVRLVATAAPSRRFL